MTTQYLTKSISLIYLISTSQASNLSACRPYFATSCDYGFDYDEDELASELSAPLANSLADQPTHPVEADEFEQCYRWFNS